MAGPRVQPHSPPNPIRQLCWLHQPALLVNMVTPHVAYAPTYTPRAHNLLQVLVHAGMQGLLPRLSFARPGVVSWREAQRLHHHVVLNDTEPAAAAATATAAGGSDSSINTPAAPVTGLTTELLGRVAACVRGLVNAPFPAAAAAPAEQEGQLEQQRLAAAAAASTAADAGQATAVTHSGAAAAAPSAESGSLTGLLQGAWVLVDADESQRLVVAPLAASPLEPAATTSAATPAPAGAPPALGLQTEPAPGGPSTLFETVVGAAPPRRCVALVQNVHFLPLGPSGTGPRSPALLAAWRRLGGVVAVSGFVAGYLQEHWPQAAAAAATAPAAATAAAAVAVAGHADVGAEEAAGAGAEAQGAAGGGAVEEVEAAMPPVRVVPLATWGVFGRQPLPDLSPAAHEALLAWRAAPAQRRAADTGESAGAAPAAPGKEFTGTEGGAQAAAGEAAAADASAPAVGGPAVDVAVLKLTPEKGCSVVAELARRLAGRVRFRVVAGACDTRSMQTSGTGGGTDPYRPKRVD